MPFIQLGLFNFSTRDRQASILTRWASTCNNLLHKLDKNLEI